MRAGVRPYDAVLGRGDGLKGYHDVTRYPDAKRIPGLGALPMGRAAVLRQCGGVRRPCPARRRVVAAEPVTDLDTTAADVLLELEEELTAEGVDLRFAETKDPVKDRLKRYGLFERFGADHFYPTVGEAVSAYLDATGVEWTDWEDRVAPTRQGPGDRSE